MYYVRVGLHGPGRLYVLGMPPRADVPLPTRRARATDLGRVPNFSMGSGQAPTHEAESTRKDPRPEEKQMPKGEKNTFIYQVYISRTLQHHLMKQNRERDRYTWYDTPPAKALRNIILRPSNIHPQRPHSPVHQPTPRDYTPHTPRYTCTVPK